MKTLIVDRNIDLLAQAEQYLRNEADFNLSWTDGRRGDADLIAVEAITHRVNIAKEREAWADAIAGAIKSWGAPATASADVRTAAQALVDHWDTPSWGYTEYTESFIRRLREALAAPPAPEVQVPLSDELIMGMLGFGDPTDQEKHLIRLGWNAAHGITAKEPTP